MLQIQSPRRVNSDKLAIEPYKAMYYTTAVGGEPQDAKQHGGLSAYTVAPSLAISGSRCGMWLWNSASMSTYWLVAPGCQDHQIEFCNGRHPAWAWELTVVISTRSLRWRWWVFFIWKLWYKPRARRGVPVESCGPSRKQGERILIRMVIFVVIRSVTSPTWTMAAPPSCTSMVCSSSGRIHGAK